MMTVVMVRAADRRRQVLDVRKLARLRCAGEVRGKLV